MYLQITDRFELNRLFVRKIKLKKTYKSQKLPSRSKFLSYKVKRIKFDIVQKSTENFYRIRQLW